MVSKAICCSILQKSTPCFHATQNNSSLLAGSDIPKSPDGWVRLSTLKTYNGADVAGNRHPTTQDIVASNTFSVKIGGNLQLLDKTIMETLVVITIEAGKAAFNLATTHLMIPTEGQATKNV